jgi:hypothetical protein
MSFDLKAICDNLAAKYAPGTIATPSGASAMRRAYAAQPVNVPALPAVVLEVQSGEVILDSGAWHGNVLIDVVLLVTKAQGDTARADQERQLWLPALLAACWSDMDLGLAPDVAKAYPLGWEFGEHSVAGTAYDAVIVHFAVSLRISQAMAA